jgi:uroporphyrinogen decarboxylase
VTATDWAAELTAAVLEGRAPEARDLTEEALAAGTPPEEVLDAALVPAMAEAGRRFEDQRFFLPELMFAARAMKEALGLLQPLLAQRQVAPQGRVVIGTVSGDLHDIGKNVVAAMLEGGGFQVHDLGTNVAPAAFADAARKQEADIIGLSALLTTTMPVMEEVIRELGRTGLRDRVKVLVGGAPITETFASEIGADAYAPTAAQAVRAAEGLLSGDSAAPATRVTSNVDLGPSVARDAGHGGRTAPHPGPESPSGRDSSSGAGSIHVPGIPSEADPRSGGDASSRAGGTPGTDPLPRELVRQTLEFRSPPRLPRQLWVLPWATSRYPEELERIEQEFPQDITTIPFLCSEPVPGGGNAHAVGTFVDAWGCTFENLQEGIIGQVKEAQLSDWSEAADLRFPAERLEFDEEAVREFCRATDQFVLAGTCPRPFERLQFLRGSEELYLDLNRPPRQLLEFLERLHAFYKEELTLWAQTKVDALTFMDDWGSQRALLVAPELWRDLFKPLYADYISIAHDHGKYAFMHSDGWITEIIPDLIEIGLDAVNGQLFCMGVEELGSRFAGDITFWGEMDRQQLLPRATTHEIGEAASRMRAALHREGGLIAQCEFGPGARPENVYAFFKAMT